MAAFLARRVAQGLTVVFLVVTIVFFLIHSVPGDPFAASENPAISQSVRATWRHEYGLDRPLGEQYVRYVVSVARGNLGFSLSRYRPVNEALKSALPNTLLLMSVALAGGFLIGILVAIAQVRRRGTAADRTLGGISILLFSVPDFWLAMVMLIGTAAFIPGKFPVGGIVDPNNYDSYGLAMKLVDRLWHLALPALTLSLLYFPVIARHQRAALLEAMTSDYIVTGRAKGVSETVLVSRHALRNSLLPIVTILGVAFPALLTGAVFIEKVFSWPGMGLLTIEAIDGRDYPLLIGGVLLGSVFVVAGSILADVLYRVLDPRQRDER